MAMTQQHPSHPSSKEDILNYLAKQGQATAQELAEHLNISPQATRRHLKDLEVDELIEHHAVQVGMGRPQHRYQLSQKGRDRLPEGYGDFALSLLDTLAETVGKDQVGSILRKQWERKALEYQEQIGNGSLQERVERLVELRRAEGYMAEWHSIDDIDIDEIDRDTERGEGDGQPPVNGHRMNGHSGSSDAANVPLGDPRAAAQASSSKRPSGQQFMITEYNCAISDVARSFPSVCGHELEMFEMALHGCKVERTHWLVNGEHRCGYLVQEQ